MLTRDFVDSVRLVEYSAGLHIVGPLFDEIRQGNHNGPARDMTREDTRTFRKWVDFLDHNESVVKADALAMRFIGFYDLGFIFEVNYILNIVATLSPITNIRDVSSHGVWNVIATFLERLKKFQDFVAIIDDTIAKDRPRAGNPPNPTGTTLVVHFDDPNGQGVSAQRFNNVMQSFLTLVGVPTGANNDQLRIVALDSGSACEMTLAGISGLGVLLGLLKFWEGHKKRVRDGEIDSLNKQGDALEKLHSLRVPEEEKRLLT